MSPSNSCDDQSDETCSDPLTSSPDLLSDRKTKTNTNTNTITNTNDHPPGIISVCDAPAALAWVEDGQTRYLGLDPTTGRGSISFELHYNASCRTAFFKVRANIAVRSRRDKINIFVFIPLECISSLALLNSDDSVVAPGVDADADADGHATDKANDNAGDGHVEETLGRRFYQLRFELDTPPSLVIPRDNFHPKQTAERLMLGLQVLSKQYRFTVHLPATALHKARLLQLCEAATTPSLRLQSMQALADISSLYGGKGGKVIEQTPPAVPVPSPNTRGGEGQLPPSYDELSSGHRRGGESPRPSSITQEEGTRRKRPRISLDHPGSDSDDRLQLQDRQHQESAEAICNTILGRLEPCLSELGAHLVRLDHRLAELGSRIDKLEHIVTSGVQSRIEDKAEELRDDLETGIYYDVEHEMDDIITVCVEDEMYTAREVLEDQMGFIEERIEGRLIQYIEDADISLQVSINRD